MIPTDVLGQCRFQRLAQDGQQIGVEFIDDLTRSNSYTDHHRTTANVSNASEWTECSRLPAAIGQPIQLVTGHISAADRVWYALCEAPIILPVTVLRHGTFLVL